MSYVPKVYRDQGGDRQVIASGGTLLVESGATLTIEDGALEPADIALAQGSVLVGDSNTEAVALDAKGTTKILIGNGTTITSAALTGAVAMTNGGVTSLPATSAYVLVGSAGAVAVPVAISGDVSITNTGVVTLDEGIIRNIRIRTAVAAVITGVDLLPAVAGFKYRIIDVRMISTEGNATTATSVDINATQGAGAVVLVANAVAGLTDSTVLTMGDSNSAVLPDGASYLANDANTVISMKQTTAGGDLGGGDIPPPPAPGGGL